MRWQSRRRSSNIDDRRGARPGAPAMGGLGLLLLVVVGLLFGVDPITLLQIGMQGGGISSPAASSSSLPAEVENELGNFAAVVLADTEDAWNRIFAAASQQYQEPRLVLFTGAVQSACGFQEAAVGPFYCPSDQQVYIDLSFFRELSTRFGAPGDFAQAYVLAHEVGHHVQNLLGTSDQVHRAQQRAGRQQGNALSVRLELQADCYAGIWAYHAQSLAGFLESGDIEEGLRAAAAIGDDQIQRRSQGYVVPESFTHGSSEQRVRWFRLGLASGNVGSCDTFAAEQP